jgi:hypothetical protein
MQQARHGSNDESKKNALAMSLGNKGMVTVQTQYISRAGKPCPSKTTTFAIHE